MQGRIWLCDTFLVAISYLAFDQFGYSLAYANTRCQTIVYYQNFGSIKAIAQCNHFSVLFDVGISRDRGPRM